MVMKIHGLSPEDHYDHYQSNLSMIVANEADLYQDSNDHDYHHKNCYDIDG